MNSELSRNYRKKALLFCAFLAALLMLPGIRVSAKGYDPHADSSVYFSVKDSEKRIALSFDDGPLIGKTDRILDVLDKYGVKATFFMVGSQAGYCRETAVRVMREGHEIGNHTHNHKSLAALNEKELDIEISEAEKAIFEACGYIPSLFRPPEGVCTEKISKAAKYRGYSIIMWSVDTLDWQGKSAQAISENVLANVKPGAVILMHDGIFAKSHTAEALDIIIPALLAEGYSFVTVGELISERVYE